MPFITGSQPWLKSYMLHALAHPPNPPALNAHYLQAISSVTPRRQLSVYDGRHTIPAVLSPTAASILDADEDDTGVTTRNLLGHVLAPVSVIVIPDMTTTPPTAILVLQNVRVFADRVHQRPIGHLQLVYTDPDVCDSLRAIVGRQLASYATATVLERADRAAEMQIDPPPEADAFFEKLLHDPSIPPSGLLGDPVQFAFSSLRGTVVGGGATESDDRDALAIIPENPTPPDADKPADPGASAKAAGAHANQHDPEWDIKFTQDPADGGGSDNVAPDALPQTQHFAIEDDDDDDDDDSDGGGDGDGGDPSNQIQEDENQRDTSENPTKRTRDVKDIAEEGSEDKNDNPDVSSPTQTRSGRMATENPSGKESVVPSADTNKRNKGGDSSERGKGSSSRRRARGAELRSEKDRTTRIARKESEPSSARPSRTSVKVQNKGGNKAPRAQEPRTDESSPFETPRQPSSTGPEVVVAGNVKKSGKSFTRTAHNDEEGSQGATHANSKLQTSPGRVTRSATKKSSTGEETEEREGKNDEDSKKTPQHPSSSGHDGEQGSPRQSPRMNAPRTPPRRPRTDEGMRQEPRGTQPEGRPASRTSPRSPVRRSPRVQNRKNTEKIPQLPLQSSPLTRSAAKVASRLDVAKVKEGEENSDPGSVPGIVLEKEDELGKKPRVENEERGIAGPKDHDSIGPTVEGSLPESAEPVEEKSGKKKPTSRGKKRTASTSPEQSEEISAKRQHEDEPFPPNSKPFLDKAQEEMAEMKRFRDRINDNPDGYKLNPHGFLPSIKLKQPNVRRRLQFPPPPNAMSRSVDVPESAPM